MRLNPRQFFGASDHPSPKNIATILPEPIRETSDGYYETRWDEDRGSGDMANPYSAVLCRHLLEKFKECDIRLSTTERFGAKANCVSQWADTLKTGLAVPSSFKL